MKIKGLLFILITAMVLPVLVQPCTTFCFQDNGHWVYGRNFDWEIEHCLIVVNKSGVSKTAHVPTETNPAKWVSKYGSVTFNQYGREFPLGGINQAGLVVECMWLRPTRYPVPDARPELSELQWIQYQLDNFATVAEVIASDKTVRIDAADSSPLHFLICDSKGNAAAVEFLDGKMVVRTGRNLPSTVLTNSTYDESEQLLRALAGEKEYGKKGEIFNAANYSLKRFIWAGEGVKNWEPKKEASSVDYAFKVLEKVTVSRTMFSIVYDVKNRQIYFRTKSNPDIRFFGFQSFDFSCGTPVKILDMSTTQKGDVTALFKDYTFEDNYELVRKSFSGTAFLAGVPEEVRRARAQYPDTLPCASSATVRKSN